MTELLRRAERIAREMHSGQLDKVGEKYIKHPMRVAGMLQAEDEKIVAWLHDAVEDTALSLSDLRHNGFPEHIIEAINAISKRDNESKVDYLARVKANPLARTVKFKDLEDNTSPERFDKLEPDDKARLSEKYNFAIEYLTN